MGMYTVLSVLFLFLMYREIERGPGPDVATPDGAGPAHAA
jgi:hypothetical protein